MAERTALVFGATGMLGHRVVPALAADHTVHATARDVDAAAEIGLPATLHRFDAGDGPAAIDALLADVRPGVVVNCIGIVKQLDEGKQPIPSITVNSLLPHLIAAASERHGARFIHVSTDCVFAGDRPYPGAYTEDDPEDARDLYGRSKLLGEVPAPALTLRTSIIGPELGRATGLLEWFRTQEGAEVTGFRNAWFSGLTTGAFADVIVAVARDPPALAGLYQGSSEPISKHELLVALRDALGVDCSIAGVAEPHINRVLDSARFRRETGIAIPSWDAMLGAYRKESNAQAA